ncbi:MAG: hypothetical protein Q9204_005815 [Flavoplaca sp. TL-2023a]
MPSHQQNSNRRFEGLSGEQSARDSATHRDTMNANAEESHSFGGDVTAPNVGDKRRASTSPDEQPKAKVRPRTLAENAQFLREKAAEARARNQALEHAPENKRSVSDGLQTGMQNAAVQVSELQTQKASTSEHSIIARPSEPEQRQSVLTAPIEEAFLHHDEPTRAPRWGFCTFGQLDKVSKTPWLIGELTEQSDHGYALTVKFDTLPATGPYLSLRLLVEITPTGLPFERRNPYDYAEYRWTLSQGTSADWRTVQNLSYYRFTDWIEDATQEILALPQVVEAMRPENRDKAVVVTCKLHQDSYTDFESPFSWSKIPWNVAREFQWLARRPLPDFNSFLFIPDDIQDKVKMIPQFRRLVNQ